MPGPAEGFGLACGEAESGSVDAAEIFDAVLRDSADGGEADFSAQATGGDVDRGCTGSAILSTINAPQDFKVAALLGLVEGVSGLLIVGKSTNLLTVDPPITVGFPSGLQPFPTANESWEIVSDSAADTAAGTGARTALISYLDSDYIRRTSLVTLNGTTPVSIAANCMRHQSCIVVTAGSGRTNAGLLTVRVSGGGATRASVPIGFSSSRQASFTIPAGFRGYVQGTSYVVGKATGLGLVADIAAYVHDSSGVTRLGQEFTFAEPGLDLNFPSGILIPEKITLEYRSTAVSANATNISVISTGLLIDTAVLKWPVT